MRQNAEVSIQDSTSKSGIYPCAKCGGDTSHTILVIVNSNHFDGEGLTQFWDHYLTVRCNGCGTIGFCHVSKCSEEQDFADSGTPFLVQHKTHYPGLGQSTELTITNFVEIERIQELEKLAPSSHFDTLKLRQMLAELNQAYAGHAFLSCMMLVRSIMNHVPPIFGCDTFTKIANNYGGGGMSFSKSMRRLDDSAKNIADSYLHLQIRANETLPTKTQVDFKPDIDLLLGEVIRVLGSGSAPHSPKQI